MKLQQIFTAIGGLSICLVAAPSFAKLSLEEVNSIAKQTTVLIAPGLTPELIQEIENNRNNPLAKSQEKVWNPGSGVIVAKEGKKYYVLTVAHNFPQRFLDQNVPFGIRTSDRQIHVVKEINDSKGCPLKPQGKPSALIRFGCRLAGSDVRGIDLALVTFESDKNYPVASLGDARNVKKGNTVYISGWPDPEKELDTATGKCRGKVAKRQRRLAWGPVMEKIDPSEKTLGYSIFYVDNTRAGMSGGPVFDENGLVVGNHGLGRSTKPKCGVDVQQQNTIESASDETGKDSASTPNNISFASLMRQYSSSQNLDFSLNLITRIGINILFNRQLPSADFIKKGMGKQRLQPTTGRAGRIEFDGQQDGVEDPNDTVDDVYKIFTFRLEGQLRDEPSTGCGSILLGDSCKK